MFYYHLEFYSKNDFNADWNSGMQSIKRGELIDLGGISSALNETAPPKVSIN